MSVYLKKLYEHELGYRNQEPGGAGRFFFIPKKIINFFPPLSENILNDSIYLQIITEHSTEIVLSRYVYHNSKIANQEERGRDEHRLYLNSKIDPNRNYFKPEDIVAIKKFENGEQVTYKIFKFDKKTKNKIYEKLNNFFVIEDKNQNHILIENEKEINFLNLPSTIETTSEGPVLSDEEKPKAFAMPIFDNNRRTYMIGNMTKKIRSQSFRDLVMLFYDYKCAITGKDMLIEHNNISNLQAAHIIAVGHGGGDNPANGIPLIHDLHWAFEYGFFTISDDFTIMVHPKVKLSSWLKKIDGMKLNLPEDSRAKPNLEALKWHRDNFFGKFLKN